MNNLLHSEYNVVEKHFNDRLSDELEIHFLNLAKVKEQQENFEQDEKKKKLVNTFLSQNREFFFRPRA